MKLELPKISRTTLALYAGASGDHNPMHIDLDVAKSAGMDDVFAHGMLNMAYLGRLLTANFPQEKIRSFTVRFTSITPLHGKPTAGATVAKVEDGLTHLDLTMALEDGTVTLAGTAVIEGEIAA
ncbi:MaoC/PaaZ C-terminal domain-containing protein [Peterkaempfera sp. SMS 1(5)a]|uniref:MaoC/PaaZ C-terminal domain-containing protein n=1 Tax=Peterkaempfera podocarpi TaxID=3232308 RepID=UPI00366E9669